MDRVPTAKNKNTTHCQFFNPWIMTKVKEQLSKDEGKSGLEQNTQTQCKKKVLFCLLRALDFEKTNKSISVTKIGGNIRVKENKTDFYWWEKNDYKY